MGRTCNDRIAIPRGRESTWAGGGIGQQRPQPRSAGIDPSRDKGALGEIGVMDTPENRGSSPADT